MMFTVSFGITIFLVAVFFMLLSIYDFKDR